MNEKERMTDLLLTEKKMSTNYNTFASECSNTTLRDAFLTLLKNCHLMQSQLFQEAQGHGWYPTTAADGQQINQAYQTFSALA